MRHVRRTHRYDKLKTQRRVLEKRDDFPKSIKDTLFKRVGGFCSNPSCRTSTSGPHEDSSKAINIGVAAHITAASPGGPRYDSTLRSGERCAAENGIWLCGNCGKLIDSDTEQFTVSVLKSWKTEAEFQSSLAIRGFTDPASSPLKEALLLELSELRMKASLTSYILRSKTVRINRAFYTWFKAIIGSYEGALVTPEQRARVELQSQLEDEQLEQLHLRRYDPNRAVALKKLDLPILEANIDKLPNFPHSLQRAILDVKSNLDLFNQEVDFSMSMFQKTFDPAVGGVNREAVLSNIHKSYRDLTNRAETLANKITNILRSSSADRDDQSAKQ